MAPAFCQMAFHQMDWSQLSPSAMAPTFPTHNDTDFFPMHIGKFRIIAPKKSGG